MLRKMRYRHYQKWFCKQFLKKSKELKDYRYYLKHCSKKESLPFSFCDVALYDVIDNNGMNRLIKSIYKLKSHKKTYNVDTPYLYHKFKKLNYINSNLNKTITGIIAKINLKSNKWIHSITIDYTYLNSSQCVIQYTFRFKKIINTYLQIHNFVVDEIKKVKKEQYFHSYANKKIIQSAGYKDIFELDNIFFADILQGYICELFYTEYGKAYKLPIEYCMNLHKYNVRKRNRLRKPFLCEAYEYNKKHIIVSSLRYERYELFFYNSGKYLPSPSLLRYFSYFTIELYYKAFYHIEITELETTMRKYLNSRKRFISSKDIKWFINKIRYIKEQQDKIEQLLKNKEDKRVSDILAWKSYNQGILTENGFINYPEYTNHFLIQYEQNLEYLNSIASVQNNLVVIIVAVLTLIATLAGIIITIFT